MCSFKIPLCVLCTSAVRNGKISTIYRRGAENAENLIEPQRREGHKGNARKLIEIKTLLIPFRSLCSWRLIIFYYTYNHIGICGRELPIKVKPITPRIPTTSIGVIITSTALDVDNWWTSLIATTSKDNDHNMITSTAIVMSSVVLLVGITAISAQSGTINIRGAWANPRAANSPTAEP